MINRIDGYPTRIYRGMRIREGKSLPFGATIVSGGVNFSIFSKNATSVELVLYKRGEALPFATIPFPKEYRIGSVWSMIVFDLDYETLEYGYRVDGEFAPEKGHRFDKTKILLDPYAKGVSGRNVWGVNSAAYTEFTNRGRIVYDDFNWEGDRPLEIPMEDLVIYEANVRAFTKHQSSNIRHPGTFAGIIDKIPYLKELGINCIELLPIFSFDELDNCNVDNNGKRLYNCWGYSTVGFFAPKAAYAATGRYGMEVDELKNLIKQLHKNKIEVILDVVFNHTAEGNEYGPTLSFKGLDNATYYLLTPEGYYYNFSGCGNTFNCNNSVVRNMILDCLRYWVSEYHIDGFRFDLASILSRDQNGAPMENPPLLEALEHDPILSSTKLIAEAWDAGGLYQVGSFPSQGRWAEWNGKYRDDIRRHLKSDGLPVDCIIDRVMGSPGLYGNRSANASINFITCHDGFTLNDLVSYTYKHNEANGEGNRDGANDNNSWNCGEEGETQNPDILALRTRQRKNAFTMLLMSRGTPMMLSGDEFGNTQFGNNNAYCQDNEIYWLDWNNLEKNKDLFNFAKGMINFRKAHPVLRNPSYDAPKTELGYPEVSWHQTKAWQLDKNGSSMTLAVMFVETKHKYHTEEDIFIYYIMNTIWETRSYQLPELPVGFGWHIVADTGNEAKSFNEVPELYHGGDIFLQSRSCAVLIGKKISEENRQIINYTEGEV